jgi:hypothetical protein
VKLFKDTTAPFSSTPENEKSQKAIPDIPREGDPRFRKDTAISKSSSAGDYFIARRVP